MANWILEKDKNDFWHVREDEKGKYKTKDEAIEAGKEKAKKDKTTLRIHKVDSAGYDSFDYSNAKTEGEKKAANKDAVKTAKENVATKKAKLAEAKSKAKDAKDKKKAKEAIKKAKGDLKVANAKLKEAKAK